MFVAVSKYKSPKSKLVDGAEALTLYLSPNSFTVPMLEPTVLTLPIDPPTKFTLTISVPTALM